MEEHRMINRGGLMALVDAVSRGDVMPRHLNREAVLLELVRYLMESASTDDHALALQILGLLA